MTIRLRFTCRVCQYCSRVKKTGLRTVPYVLPDVTGESLNHCHDNLFIFYGQHTVPIKRVSFCPKLDLQKLPVITT